MTLDDVDKMMLAFDAEEQARVRPQDKTGRWIEGNPLGRSIIEKGAAQGWAISKIHRLLARTFESVPSEGLIRAWGKRSGLWTQ